QPRFLTQRIERVIDLGQHLPALLEHDRHPPELDVGRRGLEPILQVRLEIAAMRAAVRKEFDDLDLLARFDRLRHLQSGVILPFDEIGRADSRERKNGQKAPKKLREATRRYYCGPRSENGYWAGRRRGSSTAGARRTLIDS